jgi:hypothetical protein
VRRTGRIVEAQPALGTARIRLAGGPADHLPVDPGAAVVLQAQHVQPAGTRSSGREPDVGAAAGHLRGHRDPAGVASPRDPRVLVAVVARVEHHDDLVPVSESMAHVTCELAGGVRQRSTGGGPGASAPGR